jgi:hypothetical protein
MDTFQSFEHAKESMASDVATLKFAGNTVTGRHGLISIDLLTGKLKARLAAGAKVSCYINLPTLAGVEASQSLQAVMTNPKLMACLSSHDSWDDLTSTVWAYVNIRLVEHPQSLAGIQLSPEAAALFESRFPHD